LIKRKIVYNATFDSYTEAVSFIGGANRSTRRKPMICRKSLTNRIKLEMCIWSI